MSLPTMFKLPVLTVSFVGVLGASTTVLTAPASAASINFNTWQKFGDVAIPGIGAADLSNNALQNDDFPAPDANFNFSGNPADGVFNLETFLGVSPGTLNLDGFALEGSAIKNTYSAMAGDVFTLNYNFLTNEPTNFFNDYAFFMVNGTLSKLADLNSSLNLSSNYVWETGLQSFSYTFASPGTYTLAFGVVDVNDFTLSSALQLNDAQFTPIPTPALLPGLVGMGVAALRKRKQEEAESTKG